MVLRHKRDVEAVAEELKVNRRLSREANRPTGTEINLTTDTAIAAAAAAEEAQTSADGKNTVVRSPSAATAAGSYKQGDQWWQFSGANIVGLWLHSGSAWVSQALTNAIIATLDAGKITTGILAADRIGANSITTAKLAATAIDGMTVTGATLRTAASGQRLQLDINGLRAFNSSGVEVARLGSANDGIRVTEGVIEAYGETVSPNVVRLDARQSGRPSISILRGNEVSLLLNTSAPVPGGHANGSANVYVSNGDLTLNTVVGRLYATGVTTRVRGVDGVEIVTGAVATIQATRSGVGNVAEIVLDGADGGTIILDAASVTLADGRPLPGAMLAMDSKLGSSSGASAGSTLTTITGGAALSVPVTVDVATDVVISARANLYGSTGGGCQLGTNQTGDTPFATPTDDPSVGKAPAGADMVVESKRYATLLPGTTNVQLAWRGTSGNSIRNPTITIQAL